MNRTRPLNALAAAGFAVALLASSLGAAPAGAQDQEPLSRLLASYESTRQLLMTDSLEGFGEHVAEIRRAFDQLRAEFTAEHAGVAAENVYTAGKLLPELDTAIGALEGAKSLEPARDAFYELSKVLIRYRYLATGEWPEVAYCPMAKRSWLQPAGEIGNPYYGPSMPRCGSLIEDRQVKTTP